MLKTFSLSYRLIGGLLLLCLPLSALAEQNVDPDINRQYVAPDAEHWRGIFERDGREVWDRRNDVVANLHLSPGAHVADIGAGSGFFTLLLAQAVGGSGKVFAVDIAANFVTAVQQRAKQQGFSNVVGVVNDQQGTGLDPDSIDLAFVSDTYHHFEYPAAMLASIHRALRKGGELVVIDFIREPGVSSPWVLRHVRAGEADVIGEIEASGFRLRERLDFMQTQYFLRFVKRAAQ